MSSGTKEQILEVARGMYLERGLAGLTMRAVAKGVGVSATAIYRHFENKESLIAALLLEGFDNFATYLFRGMEGKTPLARIRLAGLAYAEFGIDFPEHYRIMFMSDHSALGLMSLPEHAAQKVQPTFQFLVDRVNECIADGVLDEGDPDRIAAQIWSSTHGVVSLHLNRHFDSHISTRKEFLEFFRKSADAMLRGLGPK